VARPYQRQEVAGGCLSLAANEEQLAAPLLAGMLSNHLTRIRPTPPLTGYRSTYGGGCRLFVSCHRRVWQTPVRRHVAQRLLPNGTVFTSLEDETGVVQAICWKSLRDLQRKGVCG